MASRPPFNYETDCYACGVPFDDPETSEWREFAAITGLLGPLGTVNIEGRCELCGATREREEQVKAERR